MEFSQLKTLIHVAELGSISKAADRLGIAQPALSRQIRLLEEELKAPLFVRHGRGMVLTDLGRQVLRPAGEVLGRLEEIRRLAERGQHSFMGRVRFGMTPTVAEIMSVPLAERVRSDHPGLSLCLSSAFSGHLLDWLKREEIDCCVSYDPEAKGAVRTRPILVETLMLVGDASSDLSEKRPVSFAEIATRTMVLPSPMHGLRRIVDDCASRAGITITPALEADSFGAMIDLVRAGFGMTILPLAPIYQRIRAGELRVTRLMDPTPSRRVVMTYPADRPISPATRYTGAAFAEIAAQLVANEIWAGEMILDEFTKP
ncbi:LysR family transcriptional regulator [Sphingobium sp. CCH11-B1]|uniref:LysR family transcriptional regulator n=1 Tax=Sphingobium sp. CCH11-B1 TaxID=1768781 RepID=UPI00083348CB|nr:LysR substrate-binding domain-containing protein [Sphingobium sp. CCH11-B1]